MMGAALLALASLLLTNVAGTEVVLEVRVYYPESQIRALANNAVFTLALCYRHGCPAQGMWNQSRPGQAYDPQWTIFGSDRNDMNLFVKEIRLPDFVGGAEHPAYVTFYAAADPPGDPFGLFAIKDACNTTTIDPVSNDCVSVGTPYKSDWQPSGRALVTAYPYFGAVPGVVQTLFPSMYAPQLDNFRSINVYVPASLQENGLARAVNVLVLNDGTRFFTEHLAFVGGFDRAVLTSAIPETVIIGIPQNATGCQRQYELTFSVTSEPTQKKCASGGVAHYLAFVQDTVVPAVLEANNMRLGEMAMAGVSYGGLAACYAASVLPHVFRRVFCLSPSVWWNYGQLVQVIADNAAATGELPQAVTIYAGTTEMADPNCVDVTCSATTEWFTYINATAHAWVAAGVDNVFFFTQDGGQHDTTAWATAFATGIVQMYRSNFTAKSQSQYDPNVLYPQPAADGPSSPKECDRSSGLGSAAIALLVLVLLETLAIGTGVGYWFLFRRSRHLGFAAEDHDALATAYHPFLD